MLDAWHSPRVDAARVRRLLVGVVVGTSLVAGVGYGATLVKAAVPKPPEEEDTVVEVALVESPDEMPAKEEPIAEVTPDNVDPAPRAAAQKTYSQATHVPDAPKPGNETYDDSDWKPSLPGDGSGDGSGKGKGSGKGGGGGKKRVEPKEPEKPPPPPKLSPLDYDAAICKLKPLDQSRARDIGVEGTVVVKYTVTESGAIVNPKVVKGPAELHGLALAAIQSSTCTPAKLKSDGSAITTTRNASYPVRFKTK